MKRMKGKNQLLTKICFLTKLIRSDILPSLIKQKHIKGNVCMTKVCIQRRFYWKLKKMHDHHYLILNCVKIISNVFRTTL